MVATAVLDRHTPRVNSQAMNLSCRLGRHHWRQERTEDGSPYKRCERCGKDHFGDDHERPEMRGGLDSLGGSLGPP